MWYIQHRRKGTEHWLLIDECASFEEGWNYIDYLMRHCSSFVKDNEFRLVFRCDSAECDEPIIPLYFEEY